MNAQYPVAIEASTTMDIVLDTALHQYDGEMKVVYTNNSPETLDNVFWHLFFNAFQPGSMMDVRSRTMADPDRRVGSRIVELPEHEWGWQRIESVKVNGMAVSEEDGTVMVVKLNTHSDQAHGHVPFLGRPKYHAKSADRDG